jgi:hypothetical protein
MGRKVVDSRICNPFSNSWICMIGSIACVLHSLIWFVMRFISQIICEWIPIYFFAQETYSQVLCKWVPIYVLSLLKNFFFQILYKLVPMFSFFKTSTKLQVVDPTHEQIKFAQSLIKSTQVWSFIEFFFLQTNPLPTNPIDSNN